MNSWFGRRALCATATVTMLAGCSGGSGAPLSPSARAMSAEWADLRPAFSVLYRFAGAPDGADPYAGLVNVNGTFYGTTAYGGSKCPGGGCGTIYKVSASGKETVLYRFAGKSDGAIPYADLINVNGTFYGTTVGGGDSKCTGFMEIPGCGTVFKVNTSGKLEVLYRFKGGLSDGANPFAPLLNVNGKLYGTTLYGGSGSKSCYVSDVSGCGTVFSITTSGTERVLYSFKGYPHDGAYPQAGLVAISGTLYSTTASGGANCAPFGCGTVFNITTFGKEGVLHSFSSSGDGEQPLASLLNVKGTLYGTTPFGGAYDNGGSSPSGTVFKITTSGKEGVLHSFGSSYDGSYPRAVLINVDGTLYGTTVYGGSSSAFGGTLFKITTSGKEAVLHSFDVDSEGGYWPVAGLLNVKGVLYGTTESGGSCKYTSGHGCGTVFALKL